MQQFPDDYFDLAIVDPPYAVKKGSSATSRQKRYGQLSTVNDMKPDEAYFKELFRVSKNQIVWGYNHLSDMLPPTTEFIFWYKQQPVKTYSDGELAWTSYNKTAKCFDYPYFGACGRDDIRIHPTQKPIVLYNWILKEYAQPGYKLLDTHVGSASSLIAFYKNGYDFVGFEIDKQYYISGNERLQDEMAQVSIFDCGIAR